MTSIPQEVIDRFWAHVDKSGDCWIWTGATNSFGYGNLTIRGKSWQAHRFVATLIHGPLPSHTHVLHHCDNPPCCNPDHLFLGSNLDNIRDRMAKGRGRVLSPEQDRDIAARYQAGERSKDVCELYGISDTTFLDAIRRTGTPIQHRVVRNFAYTPEQADIIRAQYAAGGITQLDLAIQHGLATGTIWCIIHRFHGR